MTPNVIGKMDYEGDVARIEGDSVQTRKMTAKVAGYLKNHPLKGKNVVAQIVEGGEYAGWIEHVEELPLEEPGALAVARGNGTCTSPVTPPKAALKTVEGQITFIDPAAHKITIKDRAGTSHTMIWPPALHDKMSQQKQWWFIKVTGEHEEDVDLWKLIATDFFKRPEDWPAKGGNGGRSFTPRNEKPMVYESAFKSCVDLVQDTDFPDMSYADRVEEVRKAAEKIAKWIVTEGGA